jgi:hypothetical protein
MQTCEEAATKTEVTENTQDYNGKVVLLKYHHPRCLLCGGSPRQHTEQQRPQALQVPVASPFVAKKQSASAPEQLQQRGQSVQATNINSLSLNKMLKVVVTVVQQIMTESNGPVLEEATILAITKIVLNLIKQNGH